MVFQEESQTRVEWATLLEHQGHLSRWWARMVEAGRQQLVVVEHHRVGQ